MRFNVIELLGIILGSGVVTKTVEAIVKFFLRSHSEKKKSKAEADKAELDVTLIKDEHVKSNIMFLEQRLQTLGKAYTSLQDKMNAQAKEYNNQISQLNSELISGRNEIADMLLELKYYKGQCCSDLTCPKRQVCTPFNCCD